MHISQVGMKSFNQKFSFWKWETKFLLKIIVLDYVTVAVHVCIKTDTY